LIVTVACGAPIVSVADVTTPICTVRLSTSRPSAGDVITMLVITAPGAHVSGTSAQYPGGSSWEMQPTEPANAKGYAWLYQKISVPTRSGTVTVTVHLSLNGNFGTCQAHYRVTARKGVA
jgi:hypothetical protein